MHAARVPPVWLVGLVLLGGLGLFHGAAAANEKEFKSNRLLLGLGAGIMRFDSNVKFTDKAHRSRGHPEPAGDRQLPDVLRLLSLFAETRNRLAIL